MNKLTYWYHTRSRKSKRVAAAVGVLAGLASAVIILYILMVPTKVLVRYGTIVRDPVDGRVWEERTKTIWVGSDKVDKYTLDYVDKLSPEHERQRAEENAKKAEENARMEQLSGLEKMDIPMTTQELVQIRIMLADIDIAGVSVIQGIELSNALSQTKSKLVNYRNQVAGISVTAELQPFKERVLTIFDKYIQACDLYLLAMTEMDMSFMEQANALVNEANALVPQ